MSKNIFKKNNILINGLLSDTFKILRDMYNQATTMFSVSSAWGQILFVLQNLSQMILYFIEDSITELNMENATRDHSVRSLARIAGYDPGRAVAAQGEISLCWNRSESDAPGGAVIINNYSQIRCQENGKLYSLIFGSDKMTIPLSVNNNDIRVKIVQGTFYTNVVTGNGNALQSFNLPSNSGSYIDQFYVDVYVNDEKWKRYDSLYDIPLDGKGYITKTGIQQGLDIYFGNSNFGKVPQKGSIIKIIYLISSGFEGNVISPTESNLNYQFMTDGTDLFGGELNLNNYININGVADPLFGNNPESIGLIKLVAPKTSRSYVFANAQNYEVYLNKLGLFSQIEAFSTFDDNYIDDDNIVYLFLVPDITLTMKSNQDYFDLPLSNFMLSTSQKSRIVKLIEDTGSMIATTVIKIIQPIITKYVINVVISMFEGYDPETIKQSIRNIISDYMINLKRRDYIPKSDLIGLIESINGIDSVSVYFVCENDEKNIYEYSDGDNKTLKSISNKNMGLNEFGDIIIGKNELPVIRGGWKDRYGSIYEDGISKKNLCALNISISNIVPKNFNSSLNSDTRAKLIKKNN